MCNSHIRGADIIAVGWCLDVSICPELPGDSHVQPELRSTALAQYFSSFNMHITHLEILLNKDSDTVVVGGALVSAIQTLRCG